MVRREIILLWSVLVSIVLDLVHLYVVVGILYELNGSNSI